MRSEFQYFMNQEDHTAFDEHILSIEGVSIKLGEHFDEVCLDDGFIQYERSQFINGVLTAGRIAIASTDLEGCSNISSHEEIESLYKKLRRWLKKKSHNKLVCYNEKLKEPTTQPIKNFWLAPSAEVELKESGVKLKQFESGNVAFKLA